MLVLFPPLALLHVKGDGKNLFVFRKQEDLLEQMQLLFIIFLTAERQLTEINIHLLPYYYCVIRHKCDENKNDH